MNSKFPNLTQSHPEISITSLSQRKGHQSALFTKSSETGLPCNLKSVQATDHFAHNAVLFTFTTLIP